MSRIQRVIAGCLLAAAALSGITERSHGQGREQPRQGQDVRGIVKSVDASTITVTIGGGRETAPTEKTYAIAKDVEVCIGGGFRVGGLLREAKLADLSAGTSVGLSLTADLKTVEAIMAEEPMVRGILKSVDAKKKSLTVSLMVGREESPEAASYQLAADAEIAVDDGRGKRHSIHEGKLEDLTEGAIVTIRLSLDKKKAHTVLAEGSMFGGVIKSLDADKRSLTLVVRPPRGDDAGEERVLAVAKEAIVLIDDGKGRRLSLKEAKLADMPIGSAAVVKLAVDQSFVMLIKAEGPSLFGLLKSVDTDKRTITIAIPKGRDDADEKTLPLAKDARVTLEGNDAKLADLKVGENGPLIQLRLSLDQKTVQTVSAHQPRAR